MGQRRLPLVRLLHERSVRLGRHRFRHASVLFGCVLGTRAKFDRAIAVVVSFHRQTADTVAVFAALPIVPGEIAEMTVIQAATNSLCFASRTTRTTLARLIRYFFATSVSDIPARRSRTSALRSTLRGARPSLFPSRRALRMPALTRSTINDRSNSAIEPTIARNMRPIGPLVSIASLAEI